MEFSELPFYAEDVMKGKYGGPMSVDQLYQAIYQDREFFRQNGITHLRSIYLYFTPCDAYGRTQVIRDRAGNQIDGYQSAGGYRAAADEYESDGIEPRAICRTTPHSS